MKTFFDKHRDILICLALIIATVGVYRQVGTHEFLSFDDNEYVTENRHVQAGLTSESVRWAFTSAHASNWHPLTWLSHMLDCQLFGLNAGRHHLVNVIFHIANSLLLFLVFRRMTGERWRSAFVAAAFVLHPLHVESVAWVAERKDVLSTFFWLLTMWSYAWYVDRPAPSRYLLTLLLFAFGLLSKPMLVTLPFVLLLLDYWPLGRFQFGQSTDAGDQRQRSLPYLLGEKAPFFVLAAVSSVVTFLVQQSAGAIRSFHGYPFPVRIANALVTYVTYIAKMIWPSHLAVFYPYPDRIPAWQVVGACFLLAAVSALAIRFIRRSPYLAVGCLWYLGTLVPVIGLVQVGSQSMADRYTYVPLIGIFVAIAWGVPALLGRWRHSKIGIGATAAAALFVFGAVTWRQAGYWADSLTLFQHAIDSTEGNWRAHNHLAIALAEQGKIEEAIKHYSEAVRIEPDYAAAHNNLGAVLAGQGRYEDAIEHYAETLRIDPEYVAAHINLGVALAAQRRYEDAINHYSEALRIQPFNAAAHFNLGVTLAAQRRYEDAIRHYSEAVRINPDYANAHINMGVALHLQGRIDDAIRHYSQALRIDPGNPSVHNNLGYALASQGKYDDAIRHYSEALKIKPDYANAHRNLGNALGELGKTDEALVHFREALRIEPDNPASNLHMGDLYKKTGDLDKAISQYEKALSIHPRYSAALDNLAGIYRTQGKYGEAVALYRRIIGLRPDDLVSYYNIACIYSKQNRIEESIDWLKKAIEMGFRDWDLLKADKDLENIRASSYYRELALP